MRIFKANYWLALIYNGIVMGIWPGAALAILVTHFVFDSDSIAFFIVALIGFTAIMAALVMCSYHFFVWQRRPRSQATRAQAQAKSSARKQRKSKLTVVH